MSEATVKVWDPLVRVFHWLLVACIAVAWITHDAGRSIHEPIGYVALGLVVFRLVWGLVGSRYARWTQFVRGPVAVAAYLGDVVQARESRYLGHNPAGAAMIVALLVCVAAIGVSGGLYTTDQFWGEEWLEELHEGLALTVLVLVGWHVAGVAMASWRHRENLLKAMVTGRKRAAQPGDVE